MKQGTIEQLMIKHEGLVFYTLDLLGCKRSDEAIAVGYEALWRALTTFDSSKNIKFSTYAVVCIKNAIWDMYRAQREIASHECFLDDLPTELGVWDTEIDPPTVSDTFYLMQEAVDEALKKLSKKKRQIAIEWLGSMRSATAIAQTVGCSQSYVSQTISQVKHLIRKELINAGYCPKFTEGSSNQ